VFPAIHSSALFGENRRVRALERWHDTVDLVATRWRAYLDAEPGGRTWAFASYVAALDAEEAAAAELAAPSSRVAA
jgi:hypothetical protein